MAPHNPNSDASYIVNPHWDTERKVQSRADTIIEPYRELFGHAIPADAQYWTMCGAHFTHKNGIDVPVVGELGQVVQSGLVDEHQFYGVDRDGGIIARNRATHPLSVNWIHGDFKTEMAAFAAVNNYRPAVVNYDGVMGPKYGAPYVKSIMQLIDNNWNGDTLFVGNFVMQSPYRKGATTSGFSVVHQLLRLYTPPDHWHLLPYYYSYKGGANSRSHTLMGSFIFVKKGHNMGRTHGRRLDDLEVK